MSKPLLSSTVDDDDDDDDFSNNYRPALTDSSKHRYCWMYGRAVIPLAAVLIVSMYVLQLTSNAVTPLSARSDFVLSDERALLTLPIDSLALDSAANDQSAAHNLFADEPTITNKGMYQVAHPPAETQRRLIVAPSIAEQMRNASVSDYNWLTSLPITIAPATTQFAIFDSHHPQAHAMPQCGTHRHLPPALAFVEFVRNNLDKLPLYVGFRSKYQRFTPINTPTFNENTSFARRDAVQTLMRVRWELTDEVRPGLIDRDHPSLSVHWLPLAFDHFTCIVDDKQLHHVFDTLDRILKYIKRPLIPFPQRICYYAGGDFIVHRQQLLQFNIHTWNSIRDFICESGLLQDQVIQLSHSLEALWHIILSFNPILSYSSPSFYLRSVLEQQHYGGEMEDKPWELAQTASPFVDSEFVVPTEYISTDARVRWRNRLYHNDLSIQLVVAAFEENLLWVSEIDQSLPINIYRMVHPAMQRSNHAYASNDKLLAAQANVRFHTSRGRCNEVSSYLAYIIQYYDQLPDYVIFIHGHRSSWHNKDVVPTLNALNVSYIRSRRKPVYVSLNTAIPIAGTLPTDVTVILDAYWNGLRWNGLMPNTSNPNRCPPESRFFCCAQFLIDRRSIVQHTREWWIHQYKWCRTTLTAKWFSSRVWEFAWHYVFLREPIATEFNQCKELSPAQEC